MVFNKGYAIVPSHDQSMHDYHQMDIHKLCREFLDNFNMISHETSLIKGHVHQEIYTHYSMINRRLYSIKYLLEHQIIYMYIH